VSKINIQDNFYTLSSEKEARVTTSKNLKKKKKEEKKEARVVL